MMEMGVCSGSVGFFRILTLIVGIIDFGLTLDSYLHHYKSEEFFLAVIILTLLGSTFSLLMGFLHWNKHKLDVSYHIIATILLIIGGSLMLNSVITFGRSNSPYGKWYYGERITSAVMGILNGLFYGFLSFLQSIQSLTYEFYQSVPKS